MWSKDSVILYKMFKLEREFDYFGGEVKVNSMVTGAQVVKTTETTKNRNSYWYGLNKNTTQR